MNRSILIVICDFLLLSLLLAFSTVDVKKVGMTGESQLGQTASVDKPGDGTSGFGRSDARGFGRGTEKSRSVDERIVPHQGGVEPAKRPSPDRKNRAGDQGTIGRALGAGSNRCCRTNSPPRKPI